MPQRPKTVTASLGMAPGTLASLASSPLYGERLAPAQREELVRAADGAAYRSISAGIPIETLSAE